MSSPASPEQLAVDRPSVARIYDYFLGGFNNFAVDRAAAERLCALAPDTPEIMRANRAFLRRAVEFLLDHGVDQFLDLGSGLPTAGNVHEVAQERDPGARVVYVDSDPVVVAHGTALLRDNPRAAAVQADVRHPEAILAHPAVRRVLDLDRPLAVLLVAVLHFVTDDRAAARAVAALRARLAPGGYLVIAHGTDEGLPPDLLAQGQQIYTQAASPFKARSRAQVARFFRGLELVEPGVVYVPRWRPDGPDERFFDQPERSRNLAGVGRKP